MKNYWKSLLFLIVSALVYRFVVSFLPSSFNWVATLLWIAILWGFGYLLSPSHKKNSRWIGKVLISLIMVFLVGLRLDLFVIQEFNEMMQFLGLTRAFQDLLIVYCAWVFFQV